MMFGEWAQISVNTPLLCTAWAVSVPLHADTAAPEASSGLYPL